jgi:hypothetical protein
VSADEATIDADYKVALISRRGNLTARFAHLWTSDSSEARIRLHAAVDLMVPSASILASRQVWLSARDEIFANEAEIGACQPGGKLWVRAGRDNHLNDAVLQARWQIDIRSWKTDVDLTTARVGILDGSTRGDIGVHANEILVQSAEIVGPDQIQLNGTVVGTPLYVGLGTVPCFGSDFSPSQGTYTYYFFGPFDFYRYYGTSGWRIYPKPYKNWNEARPNDTSTKTWQGQRAEEGTLLSVDTENAGLTWYEDGRNFQIDGDGTPSFAVTCPPAIAGALFKSPVGSTNRHRIVITCGEVNCKVETIDGQTTFGSTPVSSCKVRYAS